MPDWRGESGKDPLDAQQVADVVAAAKASPGKLSYSSGGVGGTHHLAGALFESLVVFENYPVELERVRGAEVMAPRT